MQEQKMQDAAAITAMWECTKAKTISPEQVKKLSKEAPCFGVLHESGGVMIYAFLGSVIKKKVLPVQNDILLDDDGVLSKIEAKGFELQTLNRV